jgi:transcriptional regulator PpsR
MNQVIQTAPAHSTGRFDDARRYFSGLDADLAATLITAAADVVLVMDEAGVIRDAAFGSDEMMGHGYQHWLGKPWGQTVTEESRNKVSAMLRDVGTGKGAKWRHLNQFAEDGTELPLSYSLVRVPASSAPGGVGAHSVAFGRDLRPQAALQQKIISAQRSMERDYWQLKHIETRYRLLFQVSSEALLILDAATEKPEDSNPAAQLLFGEALGKPTWSLRDSLDQRSYTALTQVFSGLRASGRSVPVEVRIAHTGAEMVVAVSLFRQEQSSHFLLRLVPKAAQTDSAGMANAKQILTDVMESAPDAFVVTDLSGHVLTANRAFLQLAQVSNEDLVRGESLERWLGRAGVDLSVLISNLRQRDVVRLFATRMRGDYGSTTDVEISAVAVTTGEKRCLGFTIRDVGLRLNNETKPGKELPRSTGQMTELVGRVPLKDIVRETTDLIEQLCIEAALELTGDNRASAAEMLGLSRQSLYVKLRRFGMSDAGAEPDAGT